MKRVRFYVGETDRTGYRVSGDVFTDIQDHLVSLVGGFSEFHCYGGDGPCREFSRVYEVITDKPHAWDTVAVWMRNRAKQYSVLYTVESVEAEFV